MKRFIENIVALIFALMLTATFLCLLTLSGATIFNLSYYLFFNEYYFLHSWEKFGAGVGITGCVIVLTAICGFLFDLVD